MILRLRRQVPDAVLLIAGEGPARASLSREARSLELGPSVRFIGNLDREQGLNDCYAAADVFVFASRTETQGLVLLEAMAQARPVVSTACLGTRSVLTAGSGACVVEEDEDDFATAVASVLGDKGRAQHMGRQGLDWAKQWSSLTLARRMADLYNQLTSTPRAATGVA
jgi:glycosyltransferase involved in cell wall biosynthesis